MSETEVAEKKVMRVVNGNMVSGCFRRSLKQNKFFWPVRAGKKDEPFNWPVMKMLGMVAFEEMNKYAKEFRFVFENIGYSEEHNSESMMVCLIHSLIKASPFKMEIELPETWKMNRLTTDDLTGIARMTQLMIDMNDEQDPYFVPSMVCSAEASLEQGTIVEVVSGPSGQTKRVRAYTMHFYDCEVFRQESEKLSVHVKAKLKAAEEKKEEAEKIEAE